MSSGFLECILEPNVRVKLTISVQIRENEMQTEKEKNKRKKQLKSIAKQTWKIHIND